jgi:hypothetical protein
VPAASRPPGGVRSRSSLFAGETPAGLADASPPPAVGPRRPGGGSPGGTPRRGGQRGRKGRGDVGNLSTCPAGGNHRQRGTWPVRRKRMPAGHRQVDKFPMSPDQNARTSARIRTSGPAPGSQPPAQRPDHRASARPRTKPRARPAGGCSIAWPPWSAGWAEGASESARSVVGTEGSRTIPIPIPISISIWITETAEGTLVTRQLARWAEGLAGRGTWPVRRKRMPAGHRQVTRLPTSPDPSPRIQRLRISAAARSARRTGPRWTR